MRHIHQPVILNTAPARTCRWPVQARKAMNLCLEQVRPAHAVQGLGGIGPEESIKRIIPNRHCERPFWTRGNPSGTHTSSESGRSLTEMLGVLAVMGVLTIGAISGFNYAMNKQRANATVNYVNQLAIEGSRQMLAGSNHLSLLDYPDKTPSGYGVELGLLKDTNAYFEVYVKDVPEAVCSQIQAMAEGWRGLDTLWINEDGKDCNKETNTMSFIFTDSLSRGTSGTRCTENNNCTGCQTCQHSFCTDTDSACPGDTPNCVSGQCQKCKAGEFADKSGKCWSCDYANVVSNTDPSECDRCIGKRIHDSGSTYCYHCSQKSIFYGVQKEVCQACPNRYISVIENAETGKVRCEYCNGTAVDIENGKQLCHGNCPAGEVWVPARISCQRCDDLGYFGSVVKADCINNCLGERFYQKSYHRCLRCDSTGPAYWDADPESCLACPDRYMDAGGTCHYCGPGVVIDANGNRTCPREECPAGEIWSSIGCQPCDTKKTLWDTVRAECLACGNRYSHISGDHSCNFCAGTISADGNTCITE